MHALEFASAEDRASQSAERLDTDLFGDTAHINLTFKLFVKYYSISIVAGGFGVTS
jgi:hypothetical protein